MAKQQIKKDVAKLNGFISFYEFTSVPVGGGSYNDEWVLSLSTRCAHELKSKASQSVVNAGSWDFVQVETFIIRKRNGWQPNKDMICRYNGMTYAIKGIADLDTNPRYLQIYAEGNFTT